MNGTITIDITTDDGTHITGAATVTGLTITPPAIVPPVVIPADVLSTFLAGDIGDAWDTDTAFSDLAGTLAATQGGQACHVAGIRGTRSLQPPSNGYDIPPTFEGGALRFNGVASERYVDIIPPLSVPFEQPFTFICQTKVNRGYFRVVVADTNQAAYPIWLDYRVAKTWASAQVQNEQLQVPDADLPRLVGIDGAGDGWVTVRIQRDTVGGNAIAYCGSQSAVVQSGTVIGTAVTRLLEDHDPTNHDFYVRRPYLNCRGLSAAELAVVTAWVEVPAAVVVPPVVVPPVVPPVSAAFSSSVRNGGISVAGNVLSFSQNSWTSVQADAPHTTGVRSYSAHVSQMGSILVGVGGASANLSSYGGSGADSAGYYLNTGAVMPTGQAFPTSSVGADITVSVDADARTMTITINGTAMTPVSIAAITGPLYPMVSLYGNSEVICDLAGWV